MNIPTQEVIINGQTYAEYCNEKRAMEGSLLPEGHPDNEPFTYEEWLSVRKDLSPGELERDEQILQALQTLPHASTKTILPQQPAPVEPDIDDYRDDDDFPHQYIKALEIWEQALQEWAENH